ncbi:DUF1178 family protein [Oricola sp.]|uniref:DUF1178 family protein n=1 Tax=Oricola sp. TaxID=1979950 RepID=UPI003BA8F365
MIKYALGCTHGHQFEAWFKNADDYESQKKRGFLECPVCGTSDVSKTLMAPNVSTSRKRDAMTVASTNTAQAEVLAKLQDLARQVRAQGEDVGEKFAEEARKIHYGETDPRGIFGQATKDEVTDLLDDGIGVLPLPDLPEDMN